MQVCRQSPVGLMSLYLTALCIHNLGISFVYFMVGFVCWFWFGFFFFLGVGKSMNIVYFFLPSLVKSMLGFVSPYG